MYTRTSYTTGALKAILIPPNWYGYILTNKEKFDIMILWIDLILLGMKSQSGNGQAGKTLNIKWIF